MRVTCEVYADRVPGDYAPLVNGVIAVCARCEARSEAIGEGPWSIRAALWKLRAACPRGETNSYVDEADDEVDTTHHVVGKINIWGKP